MILTCPNCEVKFTVSDEAIGASGRKVRCTKCKYIWFQTLEVDPDNPVVVDNPIIHEAENIEETIQEELPPEVTEIKQSKKSPVYIKLALAASFILFVFVFSVVNSNKTPSGMRWYYSALGIHNDIGISLYNISAENVTEGSKQDLLIKGRIVNESTVEKAIPNLRITLIGEGRETVRKFMLDSHDTALAPGEGVDFENRIPKVPDNVSSVIMDIGNVVSLAAR